MNISDIVRVHAQRMPQLPALIEDDMSLDWAGLQQRIEAAAWRLREQGVRPGDVVAIMTRSGIANVVLAMASARLGAAWCAIDWLARQRERDALLTALRPRLLIADRPVAAAPPTSTALTGEFGGAPPANATLPDTIDDPALAAALIQSGGTTGAPKVMTLTQEAAAWRGIIRCRDCDLRPGTRVLNVVPPSSAAGFGAMMAQLLAGAVTVFHPLLYAPDELVENLNRLRIEQVTLVPTVIRDLLGLARGPGPLLPHLRALMTLGSILHAEEKAMTMERLTPFLFDRYGFAGVGPTATATPSDLVRNPGSVGPAVMFVRIEIVDADHRPLPTGRVGRIRVRSPAQASGYFGDTGRDERSEVFRDFYAYPGDLGRLDAQGRLYIEGRATSVIIRGGHNLYPEEIEQVLCSHPAVLDAAVIGLPEARMGEVPVALIVARGPVDTAELEVHCRNLLQATKIPTEFRFVEALPKTSAGKIRRAELAALFAGCG